MYVLQSLDTKQPKKTFIYQLILKAHYHSANIFNDKIIEVNPPTKTHKQPTRQHIG
jgi:hypothetical protein